MRTLRSAAALLEAATSPETLVPIASAILGGAPAPEPLPREAADRLGLPRDLHTPLVLRGPGTLRALVAESSDPAPLREVVARVAGRLAQRSPHLLWILCLCTRTSAHVAIAAWAAGSGPARVAALVADRARIVDSDAETLRALAAAGGDTDLLVHLRWLELLGRDALTGRFYRALERCVRLIATNAEGRATEEERAAVALLHVSRLLFLSFLEAKGWLDGDRAFLSRRFDACVAAGGGFDRRVLRVLFFGTLNTPPRARSPAAMALGRIPFLNGGLFSRTPLERRVGHLHIRDEELGAVFSELLCRYRFTAREDRATWTEAAIDPEMLGRAFESLMAGEARRDSGAFYTPQPMVERMTSMALGQVLGGAGIEVDAATVGEGGSVPPALARAALVRIRGLRVLDAACGSGAFLVRVLEQLAALAIRCGDRRPVAAVRREVLERSIFGVDINPTAVWLCELRLWLSVVIESDHDDPLDVPPLPNLDHHIRAGDALAGDGFAGGPAHWMRGDPERLTAGGARHQGSEGTGSGLSRSAGLRIARLRGRYARATGRRKVTLARALDRAERDAALAALDAEIARRAHLRKDLIGAVRGRDLFGARTQPTGPERELLDTLRRQARRLRARRAALERGGALPFSFAAGFADAAAAGGFDLVIGNPPWVRLHHIPPASRAALRRRYRVFRHAAWESGAAGARAGSGFAGQVDMSALFVERSLALLRADAVLALLLPAKLWRSLAGGGVRRLLSEEARVVSLEDWTDAPATFDAVVYPSLLVARRGGPSWTRCARLAATADHQEEDLADAPAAAADAPLGAAVHHRGRVIGWVTSGSRLALDDSPGSPWLLVPPDVRAGFDRVTRTGVSLAASRIGRPLLGVKSGCNGAFVVELLPRETTPGSLVGIRAGDRTGCIEAAMLRPLLRGEDIRSWRAVPDGRCLVWTHGPEGWPLPELPRHALRWLSPWRRRLTSRSDSRASARWWSLYRTDAAAGDCDRVVWSDFGRTPRAAILPAGSDAVPLNSCYVARCPAPDDALALAAIINGPLAAAWLSLVAEPARGGYHRYLGWTMALLPLPREWERARDILVPLARRALDGAPPTPADLADAAVRAYRLRPADLAPLLAWAAR